MIYGSFLLSTAAGISEHTCNHGGVVMVLSICSYKYYNTPTPLDSYVGISKRSGGIILIIGWIAIHHDQSPPIPTPNLIFFLKQ